MRPAPDLPRGGGAAAAAELADDDASAAVSKLLGSSKHWPPGFRFHPTDEELVLYYLKRKISRSRTPLSMIADLDVYKSEPWELPERSALRSGDKQWYFFSPRDRKYPNGSRSSRTTRCGYWKATGKDRTISHNSRPAGNKKTLVYHQGRAPKGQRTDWVMYEYTLDDRLLASCRNAQESYALYKVFRKSGPGPKNGEEYGAPFREEDWEDAEDDYPIETLTNQDILINGVSDHLNDDSLTTALNNSVNELPVDDLEGFLLQMSNEFVEDQRQVNVEAAIQSHTLGTSYFDTSSAKQSGGWCEQDSTVTSFNIPQSSYAYAHPIETPEVTSVNNYSELALLGGEEEFLEIKDLDFPDSAVWDMDNPLHTDHTHDVYNPYDYFDADMFLAEAMAPLDGTGQNTYIDGVNDADVQNQASLVTSELWAHDQSFNISTAVGSRSAALEPPPSGDVCDNTISNLGGNSRGQINHTRSLSDSWFSSTLAAMLESIPSRPALASENALISRALERVSSFKGGHIVYRPPNPGTAGGASLRRRQGGYRGGFLFTSLVVGLGAIFWFLTAKVLKDIWSRFVTS